LRSKATQLSLIISWAIEQDNRRWCHLSIAREDVLPSYDDLCHVKRLFLGADAKAIQMFPPEAEHVNIHSYCLHLFYCTDEDPLPDFTRGSGSL
tara:strand:- start:1249 stop:1530 length:282 start_codon:yes stop_codon:yes gene_type:complete